MFNMDGKGKGMPGPAMAARMMQQMPMMAGQMLSECAGEDKIEYLTDMVQQMVSQATSDMSDEEYRNLIDSLAAKLREREPGSPSTGCC